MKRQSTLIADHHPIFQSCRNGDLEAIVKFLDEGGSPWAWSEEHPVSLASLACQFGHAQIVKLFLERGVDPNEPIGTVNRRLIFNAAMGGDLPTVNLLLDAGAEANVADDRHYHVLEDALPHPAVLSRLIEAGADPHFVNRQHLSPLHTAAAGGHLESVKVLVATGVPVNILTKGKSAPLHQAASAGRTEVCRWLVEHGADRTLIDLDGRTPANCAELCGYSELAEMLR